MKLKKVCTHRLFIFALSLCCFLFTSSVHAADWYVKTNGNNQTGNGSLLNPWQTISHAISNATAGDIIHIGSGQFVEQLDISKNLTLTGEGSALTRIVSPSILAVSFITTAPTNTVYYAVVHVHDAANVVIKNLTVDGDGKGDNNTAFLGIGYRNAGGVVSDCRIVSIINTPAYSSPFGYGLFALADNGIGRDLRVTGSEFVFFQKNAMGFLGKDMTATVEGNAIVGAGPLATVAQNGIQLSFNSTGTIKSNQLKNITYTGYDKTASAILIIDTRAPVLVEANKINDCQAGIYCINSGGTIAGNVLSFNAVNLGNIYYWWGIVVRKGTYKITGNEIDGGGNGLGIDGFAFENEATAIEVTNNAVKNLETGISTEVDPPNSPNSSSTGKIHYNSITNTSTVLYNNQVTPQDATCNWYGSTDEAAFVDLIYGPFNYMPWLTNGTDVQLGQVGFQPLQVCNGGIIRGTNGCTQGYWKIAAKWWTGNVGVGAAGYKRGDNFFTTFNSITNYRGLTPAMTLDGALNLGGGSYKNVARQSVASLMNAAHTGVDFPYTEAEIKAAVKAVFQTGSAQLPNPATNYTTLKTYDVNALGIELDRANNLGCTIDAHGLSITASRQMPVGGELKAPMLERVFNVSGYPNPSSTGFNIQVDGLSNENVSLRVIDIMGRTVEQRSNIAANQMIKLGENYPAGMYYVEVVQGTHKQQVKLIKQ